MSIQDFLKNIAASPAAIEFSNGKTLKEVWETCEHGDWLFFLIRKLDFPTRTFQELAVSLAESVTHLMRDEHSKQVVIDLRRWLNGEQVDLEYLAATQKNLYGNFGDIEHVSNCAINAICVRYYSENATNQYAIIHCCNAAANVAFCTKIKTDEIIKKVIPFDEVAQAARQKGIDF